MKSKNYVLLLVAFFSMVSLCRTTQTADRELLKRRILLGPVMSFGVAGVTSYCAGKIGVATSPLSMLLSFIVYHTLYKMVAKKGERYNKWHVISAMVLGYGLGTYCFSDEYSGSINATDKAQVSDNNSKPSAIVILEDGSAPIPLEKATREDMLGRQKKRNENNDAPIGGIFDILGGILNANYQKKDANGAFNPETGLGIQEITEE